jgi:PAS domain S-box-containing protein
MTTKSTSRNTAGNRQNNAISNESEEIKTGEQALPKPLPNQSKYRLQDLIDIEQFQTLQNRLNEIYSFPSAIIDNDGNILTATAWQDICTKFHRKNKECERECIKSDQYIISHLHEANPAVSYRCPHGLVDNATPIIIDGIHYGNFFTGQFFLETPDLGFFREQAKKYGFDEAVYLDAVKKVPIWSQQQLESYLYFIKGLIEVIASSGMKQLKEIEARKKIEETEKRASAILDQMLNGFWIIERQNGRILDANEAMCQLLGFTREELLTMSVVDVEDGVSSEDIQRRIQQIVRDGAAHFQTRHRRKDGQIVDVEVNVNYLPESDLFFGFHQDITDHNRAMKTLREKTEELDRYFTTSLDLLCVADTDGFFHRLNSEWERTLGYSLDEMEGKRFLDFVHPEDMEATLAAVTQLETQGRNLNFENRYRCKDGSYRWIEWRSTAIGKMVYAVARDVSRHKESEKKILQLTRLYLTLSQVNQAIVRIKEPLELYQAICRVVIEYGKFELAWIGLFDENTGKVQPVEIQGKNTAAFPIPEFNVRDAAYDSCLIATAIRSAQVKASDEIRPRGEALRLPNEPSIEGGYRDEAVVPFCVHGKVVGFLNLFACESGFFREKEETSLLEELGMDISFALELIDAETERRKGEALLETVTENTPDTILQVDSMGSITFINRPVPGLGREEVIGSSIYQWVPKEQYAVLSSVFEGAFSRGESGEYESLGPGPNGEARMYYVRVKPVIVGGQTVSAIYTATDITERKQAEDELRTSEERLRAMVDAAPFGAHLYQLEADGRLVFIGANRSADQILHVEHQQFIGKTIEEAFPPLVETEVPAAYRRVAESGERFEMDQIDYDDQTRIRGAFEIHAFQIGKHRMATFFRDITERKRAEDALRESEQSLASAQRTAKLGAWVLDPNTNSMTASDELLRILNLSREEISLESFASVIHPDDLDLAMQTLEVGSVQGRQYDVTHRLKLRDGTIKWVYTIGKPQLDSAGKVTRLYGTTQDVTDRKNAEQKIEEQLKRLNSLHAIDAVINSSFDLRTTLEIVLEQVTTLLNVEAASVQLFNRTTLQLERVASRGLRTTSLQALHLLPGEGYPYRISLERRTIHISDLANTSDPYAQKLLRLHENIVSYTGVPLIAKGQILGVLEIFQRAAAHPAGEWFDFLETIAAQTAIAIDNMQMFETLQRSHFDLTLAYDATIEGWSHAMDLRDRETEGHTWRIVNLTLNLARRLGISETDMVHLRRGALLHDIGQMGIPDNILFKSDSLTEEECKVMRLHPTYAYNMLARIPYLKPALDIPYCHHEKWDGSGYPRGLAGEAIPLAARIFAVTDVWDALCSDRPYRTAWPQEKVRTYLREQSGRHFDPRVVDAFLRMLAEGQDT